MAPMMFLERFFVPRSKPFIHVGEIVIIVTAMVLCVVRLVTRDSSTRVSRSDFMALAMGGKSLVVIVYQLLTEHVVKLFRWASLKANLILNCLEIAFWGAVAFMAMQSSLQRCHGLGCQLNWAIFALAILLSQLSIYLAGISFFVFRRSRSDRGKEMSSASSGTSMSNRVKTTTSNV